MSEKPWYKDGLRFKCTGCGQCCTGKPGYVWLRKGEAKKIADHLALPLHEFHENFTRPVSGHISLKEDPKSFDCIFLKGKRCTIYDVRPQQCRAFPWWKENLSSKEDWDAAGKDCEGINHPEGDLIPLSEIKNQLDK